jgi:hypothetical protein
VQNLPQSPSNPHPATNPPAQASVANLAAAKPAVATTDAVVNAAVKHAVAKGAAKAAMSVPPKSKAIPPVQIAPKALADVAETVAVAKKLPRQKLRTPLFQQRLWRQAEKSPSAPRVKNLKAAVVVVDALSVPAKPLQTHKCF